MGEGSDEEFLQDLLSSHRQPSRRKDNDEEEFLKDLLSSFRHSSRSHPITSHINRYLLPNQMPQGLGPKADKRTVVASTHGEKTITENRRQSTDSKEPKTKQQRTGDEQLMTLMTPTLTTKSQPTISGRTNVARQLDVPVPKGVLWDVCSFNSCLTVKTVVELVKQRIQIRLAQFKPACFKIGIASDPESRFHDGYINEGYAFMEVLWCSTPANCVAVETDSVDLFIGTVGCHNATRGSGGVDATREDYQQHVYVVFSPISFLIKFRLERVRGLLARVQRTGLPMFSRLTGRIELTEAAPAQPGTAIKGLYPHTCQARPA